MIAPIPRNDAARRRRTTSAPPTAPRINIGPKLSSSEIHTLRTAIGLTSTRTSEGPERSTYRRERATITARASGMAPATAPSSERAPATLGGQQNRRRHRNHERQHDRRKGAEEKRRSKQAAAESEKPWRQPAPALEQHHQSRQAERVSRRVMRLIPQQPLQPVNRQAQVEPARHRVDVQVRHARPAPARPPQDHEPLEALETREHKSAERSGGRRNGAVHPLPDKAKQEQDERQPERHRVDEQHLLHRDLPRHVAILRGGQQVR